MASFDVKKSANDLTTQLYSKLGTTRYKHRNSLRMVYGGSEYFDLLEQLIDEAKVSIHLQVYIFEEDLTGIKVENGLIKAANRGVKVYLLVDGYASKRLSHQLVNRLQAAGVFFNRFEPLFKGWNFNFGRRLHHKVVVVDSHKALVGGINISEKYDGVGQRPPWLDFALYLNGETVQELEHICCEVWNNSAGLPKVYASPWIPTPFPEISPAMAVRVRRNDWAKRYKQVWRSYADLFANAQREIIIASSYFLPGKVMKRLMVRAVKRGVSVKVIVAGHSDVMITKFAERFLYGWMLENKIRIFEYQKSVLHAKVALSDEKRMTLGSYNLNNISAYASLELNLDVRNKPFVTAIRRQLETLMVNDCKEVTPAMYNAGRSKLQQLWQFWSYETIKGILRLYTRYFRQERPSKTG